MLQLRGTLCAKSFIVALATLAATASFAQSTVTLYGLANIGIQSTNGAKANLNGGADGSDSRWGLRGSEDLGGGLAANFQFEAGLNPATGSADVTTNQLFQRQSWVGLSSATMGELRLGRQYTLGFDGTIGSMPSTYVDSALAVGLGFGGMASRNNDQIQYRSPSFGGFAVHLSTQLAGDTSAIAAPKTIDKNTEVRLAYANGPLAVNLTTASVKLANGTTVNPTSFNATYDMGSVKLYGGYIDSDRGNVALGGAKDAVNAVTATGKGYVAKAYVPVGANSLFVGYAKNDTTKADAYELGNYYSLSKRTRLYAIYANGSKDTSSTSTVTGATAVTNGKRYALGVIHSF